jgi:hypothetical protein
MGLAQLRDLGAPELLEDAASILKQRGQALGVTHDFSNGSVDALGAICLAAGAKAKNLTDEPTRSGIPKQRVGVALACIEILEFEHGNIASWSDDSSTKDIVAAFRRLRDQILIAVT